MNLTGLFQYENKNTKHSGTETVRASGRGMASGLSRQAVNGLKPGQTIHGEIISKNGNEVQIKVAPDVIITARLEKDMNVSAGQSMTFEVRNNSGSQIALRPLYENLTQHTNVLKALEAARLSATNELMRMVSSMMEQGMSIDKNSLTDMSKLIASHPGTNPETIIFMKNMNISITPENIQQFENYQRYEHQILGGLNDIMAEIPKTLQAMIGIGQGDAAIDFYSQLLQMFTGSHIKETGAGKINVFADIFIPAGNTEGTTESSIGKAAVQDAVGSAETVHIRTDSIIIRDGVAVQEGVLNDAPDTVQDMMKSENSRVYGEDSLAAVLDRGGREQLARLLGRLGFSEEQLTQVQTGSISGKQILTDISLLLLSNNHLDNPIEGTNILRLLGSKELNQIFTRELMQQWLIKPEQVAKKEDVEDFYSRLREQTLRLTQALGQTAKDTPLAKSLTSIQNNIEFMNQVNQMYNYIQLPLKMTGGNAHGDLYVYTNRRGTAKEDGSVSALLHLDMEHMGTMDIYVCMQDKNVSTKFYLANEAVIDFVAEHINILNERLEKRGYSLQTQMLTIEEAGNTNVLSSLDERDGDGAALLAQYSFDVRA